MLTFILFLSFISYNAALHSLDVGEGVLEGAEIDVGIGGIMFNVLADADLTIDSFTFAYNGGSGTYKFAVYYKKGSFVGHNLRKRAWTEACSGDAQIRYAQWDFPYNTNTGDCPITIPAGQEYAIYIAGVDRGLVAKKTDSTHSDPISSDRYLTAFGGLGLYEGSGLFGQGYGDEYYVVPLVKIAYTASGGAARMCCSAISEHPRMNSKFFQIKNKQQCRKSEDSQWISCREIGYCTSERGQKLQDICDGIYAQNDCLDANCEWKMGYMAVDIEKPIMLENDRSEARKKDPMIISENESLNDQESVLMHNVEIADGYKNNHDVLLFATLAGCIIAIFCYYAYRIYTGTANKHKENASTPLI